MFFVSNCPACGGPLRACFRVPAPSGEMQVWRCAGCGSYVKSPFYDGEELRSLYASYPQHKQVYAIPAGEIALLDAKVERIERLAPNRGKLLEIGCAQGHLMRRAARRGWDVFGVEIDGSARARLTPEFSGRVRFIRSESDYSAIESSRYDVVCSYQVFEHLLHPAEAVRHWVRALSAGGLLVVDTPNAASLGARWHQGRWVQHGVQEHFVIFSTRAVTRLYRAHGLEVVQIRFGGSPPVFTRSERAVTRARGLLRSRALTRLAQEAIYRFGLGDSMEIIGRKL